MSATNFTKNMTNKTTETQNPPQTFDQPLWDNNRHAIKIFSCRVWGRDPNRRNRTFTLVTPGTRWNANSTLQKHPAAKVASCAISDPISETKELQEHDLFHKKQRMVTTILNVKELNKIAGQWTSHILTGMWVQHGGQRGRDGTPKCLSRGALSSAGHRSLLKEASPPAASEEETPPQIPRNGGGWVPLYQHVLLPPSHTRMPLRLLIPRTLPPSYTSWAHSSVDGRYLSASTSIHPSFHPSIHDST